LHALLGEADAAVNLVAGGDSEAVDDHEGEHDYHYGWDGEGSWVGTLEAAGVLEEAGESTNGPSSQDTAPCTDSVREWEEVDQWGYESLWVGTIGAMEVSREADRIISTADGQGLTQEDDRARAEEETTEDENEQWDLEDDQPNGRTNAPRSPGHESSRRPCGGQARAPRPKRPNQPRLRTRSGATVDQQWEEARHNAWLRQLLSDDSSDEGDDEERYGRFAESGRWMSELYGIPQCPTPTLGRECSA
jgi:hypothetical protein